MPLLTLGADATAGGVRLRSLLFVPGDRPERFAKAAASGADAVILDLEDSVVPSAKPAAREAVALAVGEGLGVTVLVRVNPLGSPEHALDLAALAGLAPAGVLLPKAEGSDDVARLHDSLAAPVLPIATETPRGVFALGEYGRVADRMLALTWGAEDLPAAIGASASRDDTGALLPPYQMVRSLALFAAHAAGVAAIETVFPVLDDADGLARVVAEASRDGFTGMMAIHPRQVATINAGLTPSEAELARARAIVAAFAAEPGAGALRLDGRMIDRPHLVQAERVLARDGV